MKAHVIQHIHFEDLGNLDSQLRQAGFSIEYFSAMRNEDLEHVSNNECDLLVVLGGPVGVYDHDDYPYLNQEMDIVKKRLKDNKAIIGICLGAQMIAAALGASVYPGDTKEVGWYAITVPSHMSNSFMSRLNQSHVLHWHGDTFDLPEGAERIASSAAYINQGFTMGNNVLALQFHPEVMPERIEEWLVGHAAEIGTVPNISVNGIREDSRRFGDALQQNASVMWQGWLQQSGLVTETQLRSA